MWKAHCDSKPQVPYAVKFAKRQEGEKYLIQEMNYLMNEEFLKSNLFVRCYGHTEIEEVFGMVLEYMPYTLDRIISRNERRYYRQIFVDILNAIIFLHDRDIIHRDVKPNNILISGMHSIILHFVSNFLSFRLNFY